MRLQTAPTSPTAQTLFLAFCFSTDAVGDAVYIMGDRVGERYQVTKVDIDNITHVPAIGVIIFKTSSTECVVQTQGILQGVYTGLTPQKPLFIGTDSRLTEIVTPHKPTPGRRALQIMGQGIASTELLLDVKSPIILVT
jgi:hypothetical protein